MRRKSTRVRKATYRTGETSTARTVRERAPAAEATVSTTMRLRTSVRTALESWARRDRRSVADVAQELLEEGLRMRTCPGIYFATEPTGRTAKIGGTGLAVWEVLRHYVSDQNGERLKEEFHWLSAPQIRAAMLYFNAYPDEIRAEVQANDTLTPEVIEQRYPARVRVVRVD